MTDGAGLHGTHLFLSPPRPSIPSDALALSLCVSLYLSLSVCLSPCSSFTRLSPPLTYMPSLYPLSALPSAQSYSLSVSPLADSLNYILGYPSGVWCFSFCRHCASPGCTHSCLVMPALSLAASHTLIPLLSHALSLYYLYASPARTSPCSLMLSVSLSLTLSSHCSTLLPRCSLMLSLISCWPTPYLSFSLILIYLICYLCSLFDDDVFSCFPFS